MSSFAFSGRTACFALLSGLCLMATAPVEARDNSKGVLHHAHEFYAVAPTHVEPEDAPAPRGQCFTTNSPTEATKGIRHWSGHC